MAPTLHLAPHVQGNLTALETEDKGAHMMVSRQLTDGQHATGARVLGNRAAIGAVPGRVGCIASGLRATWASAVLFLALTSAGPTVAFAATQTITFDDLPAGTTISNQYSGVGVTFFDFANGACLPVIQDVGSQAASGTKVALLNCRGVEFYTPAGRGRFSTTANHVAVSVGSLPGCDPSAPMFLSAYDAGGTLLQQSSVTVVAGAGIKTPVSVDVPAGTIASFAVTGPNESSENCFAMDALQFTTPATVHPDFAISAATSITLFPATTKDVPVSITRLNGSSGRISFAISGLPTGVTATFQPNPSTTDVTLHFTVAANAPVTPSAVSAVITATPVDSSAGTTAHSVTMQIVVAQSFSLSVAPSPITLWRCGTGDAQVTIDRYPGFAGTITLSVAGLPAGVSAAFNPASLPPDQNGNAEQSSGFHLSAAAGVTLGNAFNLQISAASGVVAQVTVPVNVVNPHIDTITPPTVYLDDPRGRDFFRQVTLTGAGVPPNSQIAFGNYYAIAQWFDVRPGGTWGSATVPRLATTGNPTLITPNGCEFKSAATLDVTRYRSTNGFSFHNFTVPGVSFDVVTELFGYDQTHLGVNPCWPFGDCTITLPIPDPFAYLFTIVADNTLNGGQCHGMAIASRRLREGEELFAYFPLQPGATQDTVWNIDGPSDPSSQIAHYIHVQHVSQLSAEAVHTFLATTIDNVLRDSADMYDWIGFLRYPIVAIRQDFFPPKGHVMTVVGTEALPDGSFYIDVYDPNQPFTTDEEFSSCTNTSCIPLNCDVTNTSCGQTHQIKENGSRIFVTPSGWSFGGDLNWSDTGYSKLLVMPNNSIPVRPHIPTSLDGLAVLIAGDGPHTAQVRDDSGHFLLTSDGRENTDPATAIPMATALPVLDSQTPPHEMFAFGNSDVHITHVLTGSGVDGAPYEDTLLSHDFAARVIGVPPPGSSSDDVRFDPNQVGFTTHSETKAMQEEVMGRIGDGHVRTGRVATTSSVDGSDTTAFGGNRATLMYTHAGSATTFGFTLKQTDGTGITEVFGAKDIAADDGDTVTIEPSDWYRLSGAVATVTIQSRTGQVKTMKVRNKIGLRKSIVRSLARAEVARTQGKCDVVDRITGRILRTVNRSKTIAADAAEVVQQHVDYVTQHCPE